MDDFPMFDTDPPQVTFNESRQSYNIVWTFGGFMSFIVRCSPSFWCRDLSGAKFSEIGERSEWDLFICHDPEFDCGVEGAPPWGTASRHLFMSVPNPFPATPLRSCTPYRYSDLHMSFHLKRTDEGACSSPKLVQGRFWLRKLDGTTEVLKDNICHQFFRKDDSCQLFVCKRSRFQSERELAPNGCLILVCELKITDDWSYPPSLSYLENMFSSKIGCDATLKVQDKKFPVHKATLALRSPVFREKLQTNTPLEIHDFHPQSFKHFLMWLYTGDPGNVSGRVHELYKIAHEYKTEELKRTCADCISSNMSVDNLTDILLLSRDCEDLDLQEKAQEFFNKNCKTILQTNSWEMFSKNNWAIAKEIIIRRLECDKCVS